ncbi:MAG: nitroreductase family protein [Muribaculaceae bacterium]|nr:nitroreductase family protein [Muribaculaceae bacterium]
MKKITKFLTSLGVAAIALTASCSQANQNTAGENTSKADAAQIVLDNIMTRTSIRQFTSQPIAKDTLDMIVKAGMAAPTAMNKQPWAFVVVTEKEVLDSLNAVHPYSNLKTATAAIIVCGDMEKAATDFAREYWIQDCSAATENILLAAHALGLGAVWCGVYPNPKVMPEVKRVLSLPTWVIPLNIITMGYPEAASQPKDKWTPENVHYQKW